MVCPTDCQPITFVVIFGVFILLLFALLIYQTKLSNQITELETKPKPSFGAGKKPKGALKNPDVNKKKYTEKMTSSEKSKNEKVLVLMEELNDLEDKTPKNKRTKQEQAKIDGKKEELEKLTKGMRDTYGDEGQKNAIAEAKAILKANPSHRHCREKLEDDKGYGPSVVDTACGKANAWIKATEGEKKS